MKRRQLYGPALRNTVLGIVVMSVLAFRLNIFRLGDPIQITPQILLDLLFLAQLVKVAPSLGLFSLLGELSKQHQQQHKREQKKKKKKEMIAGWI